MWCSATHGSTTEVPRLPISFTGVRAQELPAAAVGAQQGDFGELLARSLDDPAIEHASGVGLAPGKWGPVSEETEDIRRVARDMEAMLLYHLLKDMWPSFPKGVLFDRSMVSQFYRELWLEELASRIAHQGNGMGIGGVVERELAARAEPTASLAGHL